MITNILKSKLTFNFTKQTNALYRRLKYPTKANFLDAYPEFTERNEREQLRLCSFANYMSDAIKHVKPERNKGKLLKIVTRLSEGYYHRVYNTGGGMTQATRDRVLIYEREVFICMLCCTHSRA
jgi:hypothetical protein